MNRRKEKDRIRSAVRIHLCLLGCAAAVLLSACSGAGKPVTAAAGGTASSVDSLAGVLGRLARNGLHDSLIVLARPVPEEALQRGDTASAFCAAVFAAQSFLYLENSDSLHHYLELCRPMSGYPVSASLRILFYNVQGGYCLRTELDYARAYNYYAEGLEWARRIKSRDNEIAMLSNMANVFYMQRNPNGYELAELASRLALSDNRVNAYLKGAASINFSQALYLADSLDRAREYLDTARRLAEGDSLRSLYAPVYLLYAQLNEREKHRDEAGSDYERALCYIGYADYGTATQVYLHYGEYLRSRGHLSDALSLVRRGLEISERTRSLEYRQELLGQAAEMSYLLRDTAAALDYSRQYRIHSDSLADRRKYEFGNLMLSLSEMERERAALVAEVGRQRANKRFTVAVSAVLIALIVCGFLWQIYRKQRKAYRELVERYRHFQLRLELEKRQHESAPDPGIRELFLKIDGLMRGDRFFQRRELSLDTVAEQVGSNRTYCSKAINECSGMSFYRYLDTLRIEEATRRIAENPADILFKQLAFELGYSSVSAFSKAFARETGCAPGQYRKGLLADSEQDTFVNP